MNKTQKELLRSYEPMELWNTFHQASGSINKHLLTIYSLAVGLNAKRVLDLGIGSTTRTLRAATKITGGKVFSCDFDEERFSHLLAEVTDNWELHLSNSTEFLLKMTPPFDLAIHDAAHDYGQVRKDLELILPMMRQFSLVCVHDTQHEIRGKEMVLAIKDATRNHEVSVVHLPFQYGLTILRVEDSQYESTVPSWQKDGYPHGTSCIRSPMVFGGINVSMSDRISIWMRWKLRPLKWRLQTILTQQILG